MEQSVRCRSISAQGHHWGAGDSSQWPLCVESSGGFAPWYIELKSNAQWGFTILQLKIVFLSFMGTVDEALVSQCSNGQQSPLLLWRSYCLCASLLAGYLWSVVVHITEFIKCAVYSIFSSFIACKYIIELAVIIITLCIPWMLLHFHCQIIILNGTTDWKAEWIQCEMGKAETRQNMVSSALIQQHVCRYLLPPSGQLRTGLDQKTLPFFCANTTCDTLILWELTQMQVRIHHVDLKIQTLLSFLLLHSVLSYFFLIKSFLLYLSHCPKSCVVLR